MTPPLHTRFGGFPSYAGLPPGGSRHRQNQIGIRQETTTSTAFTAGTQREVVGVAAENEHNRRLEQSKPARSVLAVVQDVYDAVLRPRLPNRLGVFNGVTARGVGLLDATDHEPEYEAAILRSLRQLVDSGDDVVVVGGGLGVSSAVAADHAGSEGSVTTYEAAHDQIAIIEETLSIRGVRDRVDVRHAFVDDIVQTRGALAGAKQVLPGELPACDVLEVDAEGAELGILRGLEQRPPVLIVESHGFLGCPTSDVRRQLERMNYDVVREAPEVPEKDVMVLTARNKDANTTINE